MESEGGLEKHLTWDFSTRGIRIDFGYNIVQNGQRKPYESNSGDDMPEYTAEDREKIAGLVVECVRGVVGWDKIANSNHPDHTGDRIIDYWSKKGVTYFTQGLVCETGINEQSRYEQIFARIRHGDGFEGIFLSFDDSMNPAAWKVWASKPFDKAMGASKSYLTSHTLDKLTEFLGLYNEQQ